MSELHFLDTGYVLALELANDQNHGAAARHWHGFLLQQPRLTHRRIHRECISSPKD